MEACIGSSHLDTHAYQLHTCAHARTHRGVGTLRDVHTRFLVTCQSTSLHTLLLTSMHGGMGNPPQEEGQTQPLP